MNTQPIPVTRLPLAPMPLDRNTLIANNVEVARRIALSIGRRCPSWVGREDLVAAGMLGLAEAAARFDPSREEPFLAFAERRIRGAVLDELRRGDIMPRRVRQRARKVAKAVAELSASTGEAPSDEAIAEKLGVSVDEYRTNLEHLAHVTIAALDDADAIAGDLGTTPETLAEAAEAVSRVRAALPHMEKRDLQLLSLYYVEELTYAEVAHAMGITSARVCQLHSRAIARLRALMQPS